MVTVDNMVKKPKPVLDCNNTMEGIDKFNQNLVDYTIRKIKGGCKKYFKIDLSSRWTNTMKFLHSVYQNRSENTIVVLIAGDQKYHGQLPS